MNLQQTFLLRKLMYAESSHELFAVAVLLLSTSSSLEGETVSDSIDRLRHKLFDGDFQRLIECNVRAHWDQLREIWRGQITPKEVDRP